MSSLPPRPKFDELLLQPNHPKGSAWGLYGPNDELNLLTPQRVAEATKEIVTGERVTLKTQVSDTDLISAPEENLQPDNPHPHRSLSLDALVRPMNPARMPCEHRFVLKGHANDDLHINTQGASHWDGLRHYPYQDKLQFYNGVGQEDISGPEPNHKIGIQNIATKGVVGRGVLLDWAHYAATNKIAHDPFSNYGIPIADLQEVARQQNTTFQPGDILIIRSGWLNAYRALSIEEKRALPDRAVRSSMGVEATEASLRWHWEREFAAVAGDAVGYEAWPSPRPWGVSMHKVLLSGWGTPLGDHDPQVHLPD